MIRIGEWPISHTLDQTNGWALDLDDCEMYFDTLHELSRSLELRQAEL